MTDTEDKAYVAMPCVFCNSRHLVLSSSKVEYRIICCHCGALGPKADTQYLAYEKWNAAPRSADDFDCADCPEIKRAETGQSPYCETCRRNPGFQDWYAQLKKWEADNGK